LKALRPAVTPVVSELPETADFESYNALKVDALPELGGGAPLGWR